jgi:hypothetical protein
MGKVLGQDEAIEHVANHVWEKRGKVNREIRRWEKFDQDISIAGVNRQLQCQPPAPFLPFIEDREDLIWELPPHWLLGLPHSYMFLPIGRD